MFYKPYTAEGRPSVPPEQHLLLLLRQPFYGICTERLPLEEFNYTLMFRWFVGLRPDDSIAEVYSSRHSASRQRLRCSTRSIASAV